MRQLLILLLIVCGAYSVQARSPYAYRRAHKLWSKYAFADAIKAYEKIYKKQPADSISLKIASAYVKLNQPENAVSWFGKVKDSQNFSSQDYLSFGGALESIGSDEDARLWYQKYQKALPNDSRAAYKIKGIEQQKTYYEDSSLFKIQLLDINTDAYEFAPMFFPQGIAFVSARKNPMTVRRSFQWDHTPFLDVYYAQEYRFGRFTPPVPFNSKINSIMHEGGMAFNESFTKIIFTRNNYYERKKGASDEKVNMLKMYFGERKKEDELDVWENVQEFKYNSDQYSVGDPTVSKDFKKIIFTSDMPGGKGGTDLYMSVFKHGSWSEPENMGEAFNTEGNERFPFLHEDGRIFFASDGRDGLGGLDIYQAVPDKNGRYEIKNMGYPINTRLDDFSFILDAEGKKGYFSSNRPGGVGMDDIYVVLISEKPVRKYTLEVCVEVKDKDTEEALANTTVSMMNMTSKAIRHFTTDEKGVVCTKLMGNTQYLLKSYKTKYLSDCMIIQTSDSLANLQQETARPLWLEPLKVEQKFRYNEIFFDLDDFSIRTDAAEELDKIVAFIKSHPGISVELSAHTDSRGSNMYNEALSLKRAESSRQYIIQQGVSEQSITAKGYGEYMLTNSCENGVDCHEEQHQKNRRTELKITNIKEVSPEQEARLKEAQGIDPAIDYTESCEQVDLVLQQKSISIK